jgi:multicomponent Na+:H+ antiporter subunit E
MTGLAALRRHVSFRRLVGATVLVFAWCAMWGEFTVANVSSGVLVAALAGAAGVGTSGDDGVRFGPLLRFAGLVLVDLVRSTVSVALEVLTPTDRSDEAIIAVDVPIEVRSHLLLIVVAVTITPGTAVVEADADGGTIYLHLLHAHRRQETVDHIAELARLACAGLPPANDEPLGSRP